MPELPDITIYLEWLQGNAQAMRRRLLAILELMRATLIEIAQAEPYGPLHVRATGHEAGDEATAGRPEQCRRRELGDPDDPRPVPSGIDLEHPADRDGVEVHRVE